MGSTAICACASPYYYYLYTTAVPTHDIYTLTDRHKFEVEEKLNYSCMIPSSSTMRAISSALTAFVTTAGPCTYQIQQQYMYTYIKTTFVPLILYGVYHTTLHGLAVQRTNMIYSTQPFCCIYSSQQFVVEMYVCMICMIYQKYNSNKSIDSCNSFFPEQKSSPSSQT